MYTNFIRFFIIIISYHCFLQEINPWWNINIYLHSGSDGKVSAYNAGDPASIPGLGRPLGEGNCNHSSTLAWKIPWTEEPGRLQSTGLQRVRHNWATSLSLFCFIDYAKAFDCVDHNKFWKILQEMGIPVHLTCLLRNLYCRLRSNS